MLTLKERLQEVVARLESDDLDIDLEVIHDLKVEVAELLQLARDARLLSIGVRRSSLEEFSEDNGLFDVSEVIYTEGFAPDSLPVTLMLGDSEEFWNDSKPELEESSEVK